MTDSDDFNVRPPNAQWSESHEWQGDQFATNEYEHFPFERDIQANKSRAKSRLIKHLGWTAVVILYAAVGLVLAYFWHLSGYEGWKWISPANLSKMETIIFSGVSGAVFGGYVQQRFKSFF